MARYRIVRKPSCFDRTQPRYVVQERWWIFWETRSWCSTFEEADSLVNQLLKQDAKEIVKTEVVREYS